MFVVRRAFRDIFGMHTTGSIVDPAGVRGFKYRMQERRIVEVDEQNLEAMCIYFKERLAIDLRSIYEGEIKRIEDEKAKVAAAKAAEEAERVRLEEAAKQPVEVKKIVAQPAKQVVKQ